MVRDPQNALGGHENGAPANRRSAIAGAGRIFVTAEGYSGAWTEPVGQDEIRLHFHAVVQLAGLGVLFAGYLDDPGSHLTSSLVGLHEEAPLAGYAVGDAERLPARRRFAFIGLVPSNVPTDLFFRLRDDTGEEVSGRLPEVGTVDDILRDMQKLPVADVLGVLERLTAIFLHSDVANVAMPEELRRLLREGLARVKTWQHGSAHTGQPLEVYIDDSFRAGRQGLIVKGWAIHLPTDALRRITAVSLMGRRVDVPLPLATTYRADVVKALTGTVPGGRLDCGFLAFVPAEVTHREDRYWFLEFETESGTVRRAPLELATDKAPSDVIETAIRWTEDHSPDLVLLFQHAVGPALHDAWSAKREHVPSPKETWFGDAIAAPEVSVIIPLYGRIDFLKHQIARFSNDPDFRGPSARSELIYVLDDPRMSRELDFLAGLVEATYDTPFRIVDLKGNYGYSTANNVGAAAARGSHLVLLNSDVIPKRAGWSSALRAEFQGLKQCGILGCRLLLEDGSIQHAGMAFQETSVLRDAFANAHPGKGFAVDFDPHTVTTEVPAVTGACLMIPKSLFAEVGGLSTDYIIGDFEDSDLCLRVREKNLLVYYTPNIELYHLERQSMSLVGNASAGWRQQLTLYNMWQHAERWRAVITPLIDKKRHKSIASDDIDRVDMLGPARQIEAI